MRPLLCLAVLGTLALLAAPALHAQSAGGTAFLTAWTTDDQAPTRGNDLGRIIRDAQGRMIVAETWEMPYDAYYQTSGTQTGTRLHRWDGQRWSHLDVRVPNLYLPAIDAAKVSALAFAENDTLVAATSQGLLKWTGAGWRSMYATLPNAPGDSYGTPTASGEITRVVYSAAEKRLYVSGSAFAVRYTAKGTLADLLSRQNSVGYLDLVTRRWVGLGGTGTPAIADLALGADGKLYAAGAFTAIGGQGIVGFEAYYPYVAPAAARQVARYTGTSTVWEAVGAGPGDAAWTGSPAALRVAPGGALHAFGNYTASGEPQGVDYRLDAGNVWTEVDDAAPAQGGLSFGFGAAEFAPDGTLYLSSATRCAAQSAGSGCTRRWTGAAWQETGGKLLNHDVVYAIGYGGGPQQYGGTTGLAFDGNGRLCTFGAFYLNNPSIQRSTSGLACRPSAASGDWTLQISGLIGSVAALARTTGGVLYAGGSLQQAATTPVQNLMVQVGGAWQAVPGAPDGPVYALLSDGAGGLYVGGRFSRIGGSATDNAANFARYTPGSGGAPGTWTSVGGGVIRGTSVSDATVYSIINAPQGGLYVGGYFDYGRPLLTSSQSQSLLTGGVARWTGTAWEARLRASSPVRAVAAGPDGALYAGGDLTSVYYKTSNGSEFSFNAGGMMRWDPTATVPRWVAMSAGMGTAAPRVIVTGLAFGPGGQLCAAGNFVGSGLLCYNGTTWASVDGTFPTAAHPGDPNAAQSASGAQGAAAIPGGVTALAGDGTFLYVGGPSVLARYDGTAWRSLLAPGAPAPGVTALDLSSTGLAVGGTGLPTEIAAGSLPVELTTFSARADGPGALVLAWTTASETNNAGFQIEYQAPGTPAWTDGGFVRGHGTTTEQQAYAHRLSGLGSGAYRLRLRQTDTDGVVHFSSIVDAAVNDAGPLAVALFPNPARAYATIRVYTPVAGPLRIAVYDLLGREVARLHDGDAPAGSLDLAVPVSAWSPGVYLVRVATTGHEQTRRFVVAR